MESSQRRSVTSWSAVDVVPVASVAVTTSVSGVDGPPGRVHSVEWSQLGDEAAAVNSLHRHGMGRLTLADPPGELHGLQLGRCPDVGGHLGGWLAGAGTAGGVERAHVLGIDAQPADDDRRGSAPDRWSAPSRSPS